MLSHPSSLWTRLDNIAYSYCMYPSRLFIINAAVISYYLYSQKDKLVHDLQMGQEELNDRYKRRSDECDRSDHVVLGS